MTKTLFPIKPTMFFLAYYQESLPLHNQINVKETQEIYFYNNQTMSCLVLKPKRAFIRVSIDEQPKSLGGWMRRYDSTQMLSFSQKASRMYKKNMELGIFTCFRTIEHGSDIEEPELLSDAPLQSWECRVVQTISRILVQIWFTGYLLGLWTQLVDNFLISDFVIVTLSSWKISHINILRQKLLQQKKIVKKIPNWQRQYVKKKTVCHSMVEWA